MRDPRDPISLVLYRRHASQLLLLYTNTQVLIISFTWYQSHNHLPPFINERQLYFDVAEEGNRSCDGYNTVLAGANSKFHNDTLGR